MKETRLMKIIDKLTQIYTSSVVHNRTHLTNEDIKIAYRAGFKKAKEMMYDATPNLNGIDFKLLENIGEEEQSYEDS
jgi:hypothetical protein